MKGSLLQGLGPPRSLHSPAASTSYSTSSSYFQSRRPARQHSSSHITRQQQCLGTDIVITSQGRLELGSDFYGCPPFSLSKEHWKGKTKAQNHRFSIRQEASNLSRNDLVGFESRGDYRKLLSLEPLKTESTRLGSNSNLWNEEQKTAESLVPTSRASDLEGELDLTMQTKALDMLLSSDVRPPINSKIEHKDSSQISSQPSPPRIETSYMVAEVPLSGSSRKGHEMSGAYQSSSSSVLVAEQRRSFQSGAASPPNIHRFSSSVRAQKPVFYSRHLRVKQEVKLEVEKFRDPWLSQKWLAQRREVRAPVASEMPYLSSQSSSYGSHMTTQLKEREIQQTVVSSTPKIDYSPSPQNLKQGSLMRQMEAPSARSIVGAQKWRDAAKQIEQNRRPALAGGRVHAHREIPEGVKVELEPVPDFGNKWNIMEDQSRMTQLQKPKEEGAKIELPVLGFEREWPNLDEQSKLLRGLEQLDISTVTEESPLLTTEDTSSLLATEDVVSETPAIESFTLPQYTRSTTGEVLEDTAQLDGEPKWVNPEVLIVNSEATARAVVEKLRGQYKDLVHACDTEVAAIDPKKESPVGHGRMICFSIYCGPQTEFGDGKCRLWVDVLGKDAVLDVFKSYFEDPAIRKVWHNYSFDKHILSNHGINARGFYADTMHLARLYDSARTIVQGGYSLEGLTGDKNLMGGYWGELKLDESAGKRSMKHLFGKPNIKKNGEEGKLRVVPGVEDLQTQSEWRDKWIQYSSFDTVCTWCLWRSLRDKLKKKEWMTEGKFKQEGSMYDFYLQYVKPFGEILVQMEANGMLLDRDHLAKIEEVALTQQEFSAKRFKKWAAKRCPDAIHMNVGSDAQIRQLLFGGKQNKSNPDKKLEMERVFNAPNTENYIEPGKKIAKKTRAFTLRGLGVDIPVESYTSGGWPAVGGSALKALAGKVAIDYSVSDDEVPLEDLESDPLEEDSPVLTSVGVKHGSEDDLSIYGKAYEAFGGQQEGKEACMAIAALCEVSSINTLISNFIQPLQGNDIKGPDGRVHCSLNINTETGRLSARRPSLQNQPALEKDRYKIRQAFVARPENSLIVADYGQLELRILAHLTDCKSMLKAFVDGGDFHSRTAMNMYPHVRKAVEKGEVILEWEPKAGETQPPVPLLKDVFGAERRKAKMLNFSIAYGKTAMGLSKDWKVSLDEAKSTVELWYSDRQEVRRWQEQRINEAIKTNHVHTLLGRTRHFPDVNTCSKMMRGHIERAAINTPVQGSAADVAMCAMLEIQCNERLRDLGWKMLLQVHDEVILEGPSESADEAKAIVVKCMSFPFQGKNTLRVALAVDAKYAQSWYAAK